MIVVVIAEMASGAGDANSLGSIWQAFTVIAAAVAALAAVGGCFTAKRAVDIAGKSLEQSNIATALSLTPWLTANAVSLGGARTREGEFCIRYVFELHNYGSGPAFSCCAKMSIPRSARVDPDSHTWGRKG